MLREYHLVCVSPFSGGFPPSTPPWPIYFCLKQNSYQRTVLQQCEFQFCLCGSSEVACQIWKCQLDTKTKPMGRTESAGPHMIAEQRVNPRPKEPSGECSTQRMFVSAPSQINFTFSSMGVNQSEREALVNETAFWRNPHCSRHLKIGWTMNCLNTGTHFAPSRELSKCAG